MTRCNFCGNELFEGRGKMLVKNDGKIFYFCSSKCENNWNHGKQGKHTRWTELYRKETGRDKKTNKS
ncbi:MAG: ribosomal protein L24e family protein [Nanoarchaeota archaeon]|nr:ribosomal protein L24e family protein [Nanoarchaeota archaeon]MBU1135136.1 ribosomal protein L24e family protein [Nanoarchaeota archaeon]MBU2520188.1 ribosomal protein L24e family protein [Nanoarchaeota archaeon]